MNVTESDDIQMRLSDINGIVISSKTFNVHEGINLYRINEDLPRGMYFITLINSNGNKQVIKHNRQ
jgi:hypothetical protein